MGDWVSANIRRPVQYTTLRHPLFALFFTFWFVQNAAREMHLTLQTLTACEPDDMSVLFWLWFLRGAGGFQALDDGVNGGQHFALVKGTQSVPNRLSKWLTAQKGVSILLNRSVRVVHQTGQCLPAPSHRTDSRYSNRLCCWLLRNICAAHSGAHSFKFEFELDD